MTDASVTPDAGRLAAIGRAAGLDAVGFCSAEPFDDTHRTLVTRKAAGLHGGMAFTYRRPERSTDPERALPGARSLVVGARAYAGTTPAPPAAGPHARVAPYARHDHYGDLRRGLEAVAEELRADGWRARVLADDNALVDRAAAYRAGIGWYGKNTNLLVPGRGSRFVLGAVVSDAPAIETPEPVADRCGGCRRCLDDCPTGALVEPGVLDARRCLAWLVQAEGVFPVEHRVALGDRIYGCDDCQDVCPINRRADRHDVVVPLGGEKAWVPLVRMLRASDAELLAWHGRWYIPRRDPRYLRRNALVALGNVGRGDDDAVVGCLEATLRDPDELLRAHAVWAARRLGRDDLCVQIADDPSPLVRDELAAPVPLIIG